jgi:hypothetical protein
MRKKTTEYINDMLQGNVIEEITSSWHSPVVLVKKVGSDEYCFAADYRSLNKIS